MKKAPYKKGDAVSVLTYHEQYGTCLASAAVEEIHESAANGFWNIHYTVLGEKKISVVNSQGRDRHGYVERKVKA